MAARRPKLLENAGATARLPIERALALDPKRYGFSPKVDGASVRIATDRSGTIASMLFRSGRRVPHVEADGLMGMAIGLPDAVLHAELECHTPAGVAAREARGWACAHVFDLSRIAGASIAERGYFERYDALQRWQAAAENLGDVPRVEPMRQDPRTFEWALPSDSAQPAKKTRRLLNPGAMVPGGAPRDLRRLPIVPLHRGKGAAERLWADYVVSGGGEGIVAVRIDAKLGARRGKAKVRNTTTIDCHVVAYTPGSTAAILRSPGGVEFAVSAASAEWKSSPLIAGEVVEVLADGYYPGTRAPMFARILRRRPDLSTVLARPQ